MRTADRRVRDALILRRAVLSLIGSGEPTAEDREIARRSSAGVWQVVLACECCALPLAARLRARALTGTLPQDVRARVAVAETAEMQRVLAARSVLDSLDDVCAELGFAAIVLKGGALAGERGKAPLDLGDVDVLMPQDETMSLWRRLGSLGWRLKTGAPMPMDAQHVDANHLAAILPPGEGLSVELHTSVDYGRRSSAAVEHRTRLLNGRRSLRRLTGATGFVTTLWHSVIKHPHRRGHIRDLVLLADALEESYESAAQIAPTLAEDPMSPELLAMYGQVRALMGGERVADDDATTRFVAWKYAAHVHAIGVFGPFLPGWSGLSHLPLERPAIRRAGVASQLRYAIGPVPVSSPFARRAGEGDRGQNRPVAVAGLRNTGARALRSLYRLGLLAALLALSGYIRRRIDAMTARRS
jgi:hypothetical protein